MMRAKTATPSASMARNPSAARHSDGRAAAAGAAAAIANWEKEKRRKEKRREKREREREKEEQTERDWTCVLSLFLSSLRTKE